MSTPKPIKKNNNQPQRPGPRSPHSSQAKTTTKPNPVPDTGDKPYGLVPLSTKVHREHPAKQNRDAGQDRFRDDLISGKLYITLTAQTSTFVASGVVAMGRDVNFKVDLVKTAVHQRNTLIIPGSSLKGVIRSAYEALTRSCLCKTKANLKKTPDYIECKIDARKKKFDVCPACRVFGAMGWQGLVSFQDSKGQVISNNVEFMPSLYGPKPENPMYENSGKVAGRKFYYHGVKAVTSKKTPDGKNKKGIDAQKAQQGYIFKTVIQFKNLTEAELGTLFVILGQDDAHKIALKVGGGKPIGMGSLVAAVDALEKPGSPRDRYTRYTLPESDRPTGEALRNYMQAAIAKAHQDLIQKQQLEELARILAWPTQRTAPEDMY
ncbi:CRISPR-associated protein [Nodosilinea sp. LEGE 07088]|uniref:RAMP superfamily CRISPR-associated protein n=1 Tax=Nodosilinea sp. LEGE 07088 TaxID=2777968 RepID=UPI00187E3729|nr:RAMP superfamily CRISPR-associated protein [Nodosilinea sp. LEGE 07088]MBE9138831.1 CRISPR-associated protein [Nodosilinea sp. LEGE 07088]